MFLYFRVVVHMTQPLVCIWWTAAASIGWSKFR